jgi:ankyrin repeat protein
MNTFFCRHFHSQTTCIAAVSLIILAWSIPAFCGEIHDAAKAGDLEKVKALLNKDRNLVLSEDSGGFTSLHWAAYKGHKKVAELLLAHKADVNVKDNNGNTPLHEAAHYGHKDVAELLLSHNADVNARNSDGDVPLLIACRWGYNDVVEFLLASKAEVNAKNINGQTPLYVAAQFGRKEMMELLLARGAEVNDKENGGSTPLEVVLAGRYDDRKEMKALLLAHGAEINAKTYCPAGDPNVRVSVEIGNVELIKRDLGSIKFRLRAHVRITNVSSDPVFMLGGSKYPYPIIRYCGIRIARTEVQASSCRYIYIRETLTSSPMSPEVQELRKALDRETPPEDIIRRIEPRGYWEIDDDNELSIPKSSFLLEGENQNSMDEILSDPHVWLQLNVRMWLPGFEYNPNLSLLLSLQERWKRYGHLIIENQKTEPVELTLPLK